MDRYVFFALFMGLANSIMVFSIFLLSVIKNNYLICINVNAIGERNIEFILTGVILIYMIGTIIHYTRKYKNKPIYPLDL